MLWPFLFKPCFFPASAMDTCDVKMYYIIIEKQMLLINAGHICYIQESRYMSRLSRSECLQELPVICMGSRYDRLLKVNHLKPVTAKEAELLQALGEDSERLKWYLERDALATALGLTKDTPVTVELDGKWLQGIVRYIGRLTEPKFTDPIVGTFFGIELQVAFANCVCSYMYYSVGNVLFYISHGYLPGYSYVL